jgi:hypothetical protein
MTSLPAPNNDQPVIHHAPGEFRSSGRGGAGNIAHTSGGGGLLASFSRGRARDVPGADDGGRSLDARDDSATRSRSRDASTASRRSREGGEGLWNRIMHPLSPRGKGGEPEGPIPE